MNIEDFQNLALNARSYRRFVEADSIPVQIIKKMVDIARISPSAANQQALRYKIITDGPDCEKLFPSLRWAGALPDWSGPAEGERPSAYIIILSPQQKNVDIDLGIASEVLQLAASSAGYASCMLGNMERGRIQKDFEIPAEFRILLVLALGRPAEKIYLEAKDSAITLPYWRDDQGGHHVPKLSLEDVLL